MLGLQGGVCGSESNEVARGVVSRSPWGGSTVLAVLFESIFVQKVYPASTVRDFGVAAIF